MKELEDVTEIALVMSDMAKRLLAGEEIPRKKVTVKVHIWEPVLKVLEKVAEQMEVEKEEVIRELVQDSLNEKLQSGLGEVKNMTNPQSQRDPDLQEAADSIGMDLTGLTKGLADLQNLAQQLQGMQAMFGGTSDDNPLTNMPKFPNISANGVKKNSK